MHCQNIHCDVIRHRATHDFDGLGRSAGGPRGVSAVTAESTVAGDRLLVLPATMGLLSAPEDGQWLMAAKGYANLRYSGLQEITAENVASLQPVWTFSTVRRGQEAAPLVANTTMFVVTPYPNVL